MRRNTEKEFLGEGRGMHRMGATELPTLDQKWLSPTPTKINLCDVKVMSRQHPEVGLSLKSIWAMSSDILCYDWLCLYQEL